MARPLNHWSRFALHIVGVGWLVLSVILVHDCRAFPTALLAGTAGILGLVIASGREAMAPSFRKRIFLPGIIIAWFGLMVHEDVQLWQIPSHWSQAWRVTPAGGAFACAFYCAAEYAALLTTGRRLKWGAAVALGLLPILFNALLLLDADPLMEDIGRLFIPETSDAALWARTAGRVLWLSLFNEALVVGTGYLLDHRLMKGWRTHSLLVGCSVLAALTPVIADWGSFTTSPLVALLLATLTAAIAQGGLWAQVFLATGTMTDAMRQRRPVWQAIWGHWKSGLVKGAVFGGVFIFLIQVTALFRQSMLGEWLRLHPLPGSVAVGALGFALLKSILESFDGSAPFFTRVWQAMGDPWNCLRGGLAGGFSGWALSWGTPEWPESARCGFGFLAGAITYAGADLAGDGWSILRGVRSRPQSARNYAMAVLLGGLVGSSLCWYFDTAQLGVVVAKFAKYSAVRGEGAPTSSIHFSASGGR